jgi:hypothetical protein
MPVMHSFPSAVVLCCCVQALGSPLTVQLPAPLKDEDTVSVLRAKTEHTCPWTLVPKHSSHCTLT